MDSQVAFIRRFVVWGVAWILVLSLLAGLVLWQAPLGAADEAVEAASPSQPATLPTAESQVPAVILAGTEYPLYFPLIFNQGAPYLATPLP